MNQQPNDPTAEQILVIAAKSGDEQAFEALFKRYQQKILTVVRRYARVLENAEDIVQRSLQKAFRAHGFVYRCRESANIPRQTEATREIEPLYEVQCDAEKRESSYGRYHGVLSAKSPLQRFRPLRKTAC